MNTEYTTEQLIFLYRVLQVYEQNFAEAIQSHIKLLECMKEYVNNALQLKEYDESASKLIIEECAGKIMSENARLISKNYALSNIKTIKKLMIYISKCKILDFDKNIVPILNIHNNLLNTVKSNGSISVTRFNAYGLLVCMLEDTYKECISILNNCRKLLGAEIARRANEGNEYQDQQEK